MTDYAEEHGYPLETWTRFGLVGTRLIRCPWVDRKTVVDALLGQLYPYAEAMGAVCVSCDVKPAPGRNTSESVTIPNYDDALITAKYETEEASDALSEDLEPTSEFLTVDHSNLRWAAADGDPVTRDEAPGMLMRGCDYVVRRYDLDAVPAQALSLIGFVNSAAIVPVTPEWSGLSFAAETLLFQPPVIQRTTKSDGSRKAVITYRFTYKPNWDGATARGWNYFWRAKTQSWAQMYVAGGGVYKNFQPASFSPLFPA